MEINQLYNRKFVIIVAVIVVFVFFVSAISWLFMVTHWKPLMSGSVSKDLHSEIAGHLMAWGFDFKTDEKTGQVFVEERYVGEIRKKLEEMGVQAESASGFSIFDDADYGMSEFVQKINYQRGLEGEIGNTIRSFADIRSARVHLSLPKKSLFNTEDVRAKASVVVDQREGINLSNAQIRGIKTLVSAAVEDLLSEDVVVLGQNGTLFSNDSSKGYDEISELEDVYARKVKALITMVVPSESISVAVNIDLNKDKTKSIRESIVPAVTGGSGYIVKTKSQVRDEGPDKGSAKDTRNSESKEVEYIYSTERSETEYAYGTIKRIGVGVVIGDSVDESILQKLSSAIEAGIGIDRTRGDRVTVIAQPEYVQAASEALKEAPIPVQVVAGTLAREEIHPLVLPLVWAISGVVVLVCLFWIYFRSGRKPRSLKVKERDAILAEINEWLAVPEGNTLEVER